MTAPTLADEIDAVRRAIRVLSAASYGSKAVEPLRSALARLEAMQIQSEERRAEELILSEVLARGKELVVTTSKRLRENSAGFMLSGETVEQSRRAIARWNSAFPALPSPPDPQEGE